jgi:undecaprenyl pyrophosphate synthase
LAVDSKRQFEKIVVETHRNLRKKYKMRSGALHAAHEEDSTRRRLLKKLSEKECKIMTVFLDKEKVFTRLNDEKEVLYNFITNILLDRIFNKKLVDVSIGLQVIASRRETNKFLNENFKNYIKNQMMSYNNISIAIDIKTPHQEKILQLADVVSWAIFRKYERGDENCYKLIKGKVVEENPLYP